MRSKFLFAVAALCLPMVAGCPKTPNTPADADAGTSQDAATDVETIDSSLDCSTAVGCACAQLCVLQCEECDESCENSIKKIIADRLMVFDVDCIIKASTRDQVRHCPGITCE
jgi:hypothetical protein